MAKWFTVPSSVHIHRHSKRYTNSTQKTHIHMHTHRLSGLASIMISCLLPLLFVNCLAGGKEEAYRLASTQQHHSNRSFPREPKGRPTAGFMAGSLHSCIVWLNRTRERLLSGCGWFGSAHCWPSPLMQTKQPHHGPPWRGGLGT